jgi:hypothetical protein
MRHFKLIVLLGVMAASIYVWYYFSKPSNTTKLSHLSGVIISAPVEFYVVSSKNSGKELSLPEAAAEMEKILQQFAHQEKIGLKFSGRGGDTYLLIDRVDNTIQLLAANAYGTAVQTTWRGYINERIQWCKEHGSFTTEGLPEPVSKNLYH